MVATVIDGCWGSIKGNQPTSLEVDTRSHVASDWSGTGDTNIGSLLFHLVTKKSSNGVSHSRMTAWKTEG